MIDDPIGTTLMLSTPAATTRSCVPDSTAWAAKCSACCDEPHCRSIVTPGTLSGSPADSHACRAMSSDCGPIWETHPMITSSTAAASTPVRSTSARSTCAPRSTGLSLASPPFRLPDRGPDRSDDVSLSHDTLRGCSGTGSPPRPSSADVTAEFQFGILC